ncbi:hypothetical protein FRC01_012643 [Tulasnella sp. 417]|nr:hypothetical protein FRC01_012643 [Tulasnella sp. 417]
MKMFWYPISYTILVLPLSINRWRSSFKPSSNAGVEKLSIVPTSVVLFIFGLSGLCNVLLFLLTRPNLLLFNVRRQMKRERHHQLSQLASTGVSFAHPRHSSGAASSPSAPGIHQRRGTQREHDDAEDNWDEGFSEGSRGRRSDDIEFPGEPNYPPPPSQTAPLPPPPASPVGSPFSNGMERVANGEAVRMTTFGAARDSVPSSAGYENHYPGADDSIMRRTSAGSSRYTTATTSVGGGTIPAGSERPRSGASATRFREHFHDDDVPISGIRTRPMDHRIHASQSMTLPVMPEPPSSLRRQASSPREGEEEPLAMLPPPPDAIYSRSASRIPPSSPTSQVAPPTAPPTGYPAPGSERPRVEEWALSTGPPQPPRGPMQ